MHTPIIGIPDAGHPMGMLTHVYGTPEHYLESIRKAGGTPVQLPMLPGTEPEALRRMVDLCDGFLLPGGGDFDPDLYGQELLPNLTPDPAAMHRGSQEYVLEFVRLAAASGKPMLGICLGVQVINIALGGTLYQDIPSQLPDALSHSGKADTIADRCVLSHSVTVVPETRLASVTGAGELPVNSFHHQAVGKVAPDFRICAQSPDGIIEAIEHETRPILGVQWHPENLSHISIPHADALFRWLAEAAK